MLYGPGAPIPFADEADIGVFGGVDEFVGKEGHVLILEEALEILVVRAFVVGEGASSRRIDGLAGDGVKDRTTLGISHGARDFAQREIGIGGHAIELVVLAVRRA